MNGKSLFTTLAVTALFAGSLSVNAQETIVDEYGTEYLIDALPADMQAQIIETQAGGDALQVDEDGRFFLNSDGEQVAINNDIIINSMSGVVLVTGPAQVKPEGWPGVSGVWHDLEDLPDRVGNTLQGYLYQPVSLASLDQMVVDVKKAYKRSGRPVVDVMLPEQDITCGVVQLVVVEATVGNIRVNGTDLDTEEFIRDHIGFEDGDKIHTGQMLKDLSWLNRSPYRKVEMSYKPGYEFGTAEVILDVIEGRKSWAYLGYENSGTEFLGEDRYILGFHWGDFLGTDTALSYQFTTDFEGNQIQGHSLIYNQTLVNQHQLSLIGSYAGIEADIPTETGGTTGRDADNMQFSVRYGIPLASQGAYRHGFDIGFDYKAIDNDIEFGGSRVFDENVHISQFSVGYTGDLQNKRSTTELDGRIYVSPGGMGTDNNDRAFSAAREGASADYLYATLGIEHNQRLYNDWSLRLKGQGQVSTDNLIASEQLGAGGYDTVRGFDQRAVLGDEGFIGNIELYTPEMSLGQLFNWENETDSLRFLTFYDVGTLSGVSRASGEPSQSELQSVGAGLRWSYSDWFRLRFDYGYPVSTEDIPEVDEGGRFHIGATANF